MCRKNCRSIRSRHARPFHFFVGVETPETMQLKKNRETPYNEYEDASRATKEHKSKRTPFTKPICT